MVGINWELSEVEKGSKLAVLEEVNSLCSRTTDWAPVVLSSATALYFHFTSFNHFHFYFLFSPTKLRKNIDICKKYHDNFQDKCA